MKTPENKRSSWWWTQKGVALLGSVALGCWLFLFIRAATMDVTVTAISVAAPSGIPVREAQIGAQKEKNTRDAGDSTLVPTVTLPLGGDIVLTAGVLPESSHIPRPVKRRTHWTGLALNGDGTWSPVPVRMGQGEVFSCRVTATDEGTYLILVGIPPVSLSRLNERPSSYIESFLKSSATTRCRAIQILVSGQNSPGAQWPVPTEAFGSVIELRNRTGAPSPQPTQPHSAQTPVEKQGNPDNPSVEPDRQAESPQMPQPEAERDLSMSHVGETSNGSTAAVDVTKDSTQSGNDTASQSVSVPPTTPPKLQPEKLSWGALPSISLDYTPAELAQLSTDEWEAIRKAHDMPFVAVPDAGNYVEIGGWLVITAQGKRVTMEPDDIERSFGLKFLPLSAFSPEVQANTRMHFDDSVTWFKCTQNRGFLLSSVLMDAAQAGLRKEGIAADQVHSVKRITVSLSIDRTAEVPRLVATAKSVEMKQ